MGYLKTMKKDNAIKYVYHKTLVSNNFKVITKILSDWIVIPLKYSI
jgi:hypothetical protein